MAIDKLKKAVDLTAAIIILEEALNMPTQNDSDNNNQLLTVEERKHVFKLRQKIASISKKAEHQLKSDPLTDFEQEKLDASHRDSLLKTHQEARQNIDMCLKEIEQLLSTKKRSKNYDNTLQETKELLNNLLELMKQNTEEKLEKIIKILGKKSIYKMCRQKGILYIPISQDIDPELGGQYVNDIVKESDGKCAGGVISWIEQCAKSEKIDYPLYADKCQKIYQERQFDSKSKYKPVSTGNLKQFLAEVCTTIKPNHLYYIAACKRDSGHAMGLRIRQDGVFEFFDINYLHAFCLDHESLELLLTDVLANYVISFGYTQFTLFDADVLQAEAKDNLYPHKVNVIQASTKPALPAGDDIYREIIRDFFLASNRKYKALRANPAANQLSPRQLFDNFLLVLQQYIAEMNYEDGLLRIKHSINNMRLNETFLETAANKSQLLAVVNARLKIVKSVEFKAAFSEKQEVLAEYKKVQEQLTEELNKTKEKLIKSKAHVSHNTSNSQFILSLTNASITLLRFITGVRKDNTLINSKNTVRKPQDGLKKTFTNAMKKIFGIKSGENQSITSLVADELKTFALQTCQTKIPRLIVATEHLIQILQEIKEDTSVDMTSVPSQNKENYLAYERVFKKKTVACIDFFKGLLNELKLSDNFDEMASKFKSYLPLNEQHIEQLLDINNHKKKILESVETMIQHGITEEDVKSALVSTTDEIHYRAELNELLTSVKALMSYIDAVKDEYVGSLKTSKLDPNDMLSVVLHEKRMAQVGMYDAYIKELQDINNRLINQCKKNNNFDAFMELAKNIRTKYSDLFPVGNMLVDDYAARLSKTLKKAVILDDSDKKRVEDLKTIRIKIQKAIIEIKREIENPWLLPLTTEKLKGTDQVELRLQTIEHQRGQIVSQHYKQMIAQLQQVIDNPVSTKMIEAFNSLIKPYLRNNDAINFKDLVRSDSIVNSFWSQKTPAINALNNVLDLIDIIKESPRYLLLEAHSQHTLMPEKLQTAINTIIKQRLTEVLHKFREGTIRQEKNRVILQLIPCLNKSKKLQPRDALLVSMYNSLDNLDAIKTMFKSSEMILQLKKCAITVLDELIAVIDDPSALHQQALTELKTKANNKPPISLFELIQLQNEISQIIPGVLDNFHLRPDYVNHIYQTIYEEEQVEINVLK